MQQCEDLEDEESLRHMYFIVRGAIMLNDAALLEAFLSEENVMDTVGPGNHALLMPSISLAVRFACSLGNISLMAPQAGVRTQEGWQIHDCLPMGSGFTGLPSCCIRSSWLTANITFSAY